MAASRSHLNRKQVSTHRSLSRRQFIKLGVLAGVYANLPIPSFGKDAFTDRRKQLLLLSENLLREWCEGFMRYQIIKPMDPTVHGALWSPGDRNILGRCADAVYPLLWCANRYQDERFFNAAMMAMQWSLKNMARPDGSWENGPGDTWNGITVFITSAMGQALLHYGNFIENRTKEFWFERLKLSGQWLFETIDFNYSNINYPAANAYTMALLGKLLSEPKFVKRGQDLAHGMLEMFTETDGLFWGEGRNNKAVPSGRSPKGCYPVDIGYNVEESLPAIALYGLLQKDEVVLKKLTQSLRVHLEFMLPDGGWDNSWGTRNHKWTWWGSRTSDGCQPAFALLADRDSSFLEAAYRNTVLLKKCTVNGILFGGPDYAFHGVKPSLHHTFCHAKALATVLDSEIPVQSSSKSQLPCERQYGIRIFHDISTALISFGPWRGTITDYDFPYYWKAGHASGGALSLLWHKQIGPLLSASMTVYHLLEPFDMQKEEDGGFETLTPRIVLEKEPSILMRAKDFVKHRDTGPLLYTNIMDFKAQVNHSQDVDRVIVNATGHLENTQNQSPPAGPVPFSITYRFDRRFLAIEMRVDHIPENTSLYYMLPIISRSDEFVDLASPSSLSISKKGKRLVISSDSKFDLPKDLGYRIFNYVPGFEAFPVRIPFKRNLEVRLTVI